MCGIAGFVGIEGAAGEPALARMVAALHHRGPDGCGSLLAPAAGIGMARLAIVGIANGRQPIVSEDGRLAIVGNGEIYDSPVHRPALEARGHRFATDSDIETLLHLFEEHGEGAFALVNGIFAVAILDRLTSRVLVARDRLGVKPLLWSAVGSAVFFASELPALRAGLPPGADLALDPAALGDYLAHGYVPAPRTIHRGVHRLPPGHLAWLGRGEPSPRPWWRLPGLEPETRPIEEWAEETAALIEDSVRLQTLGDVPAGAFLSGGLDSTTLLTVLARRSAEPVDTFTLGFREESHDERALARATAAQLGARPHETLLEEPTAAEIEALFRHLGEPFADVSLLPTERLARLASGHVKFVLSGDGGDELFGGYPWFTAEARRRALPAPLRGAAGLLSPWLAAGQSATGSGWVGKGLRYLGDLSQGSAASFLRRRRLASPALVAEILHPEVRGEVPLETSLARHAAEWRKGEAELWLDLDRRFYLAGDILEKVDRATMRHSLEARVPLLDHRLVELAARVPVADHLGPRLEGKQVLRRAFARILPPGTLERAKRGFGIPVDRWVRGPLGSALRERLFDPAGVVASELLDRSAIEALLERHDRGAADHGHLLWGLWSLAVWSDGLRRDPGNDDRSAHAAPATASA